MIESLAVVRDPSFDYDLSVFEVHPVASASNVEQALQIGQNSINLYSSSFPETVFGLDGISQLSNYEFMRSTI